MNINEILTIQEGLHDPHIFKAVFMVGGPGSGKTYVASKLFNNTGLRVINLDNIYEYLKNKAGITGKGYDAELMKYSGMVSQRKMDMHVNNRMGLLIDSTGRKINRLQQTNKKLKTLGYDTMCIYIKTSLDTALDRSERRKRRVDPREAEMMHQEVSQNMSEIRKIFRNFIVIKNDDNEELSQSIEKNEKYIDTFLSSPVRHDIANKWKREQELLRNRS